VLPCLVFSASVVQKYTFNAPVLRNGVAYVDGCRTSIIPFEPCLPSKPISLLLPSGEEAVSFDVEYTNPIECEGTCYVTPFRPGGIISNPLPVEYYTRASTVYSTDEYYPAEIKSPHFYTHYRYGHSIFIASIRPVQYNPVTGKIRYYSSVTVKIQTAKNRGELPAYKLNSFIKSQLQLEVDNPDVLENLPYSSRDGENYEYLIITTEALKGSWNTFVEFNKRRCLRTKIQTIEYINANGTGADSPEKLKNFIKQEYTTHGIVFVMLGGDDNFNTNNTPMASAITHRSYSASFKDYGVNAYSDKDVAADMFYETMDGQELADLGWELYAGRFAADNTTELGYMVDKTIKYSEQPVAAAVKKAVIAGEKKWPNINGGTCWGKDQMVLLYGTVNKNGYTTTGFPTTAMTITELFEKDGDWSKTQMINAINANQNWVFHTGHSNNFSIMKLQTADIASLKNNAYHISFTTGCYCGAWDNRKIADQATINTGHYDATTGDCIIEAFTHGTSSGNVAFVSNTRYGLGDDGHASLDGTDGSTIRFMRFFLNGLYSQKMHHIAIMLAYSKWINKQEILVTDVNTKPYYGQMAYCAYELNTIGDPALSIWTETPQVLNPTIPGTIDPARFQWESGLPYTWVAVCKPDSTIISTDFTGADGKCIIDDNAYKTYCAANAGGKVIVRVKAHNYLPYEKKDITIGNTGIDQNDFAVLSFSKAYFNKKGNLLKLTCQLKKESTINLSLFNAKGICIKTGGREFYKSGIRELAMDIGDVANGIYYYRLMVDNKFIADKIIINR